MGAAKGFTSLNNLSRIGKLEEKGREGQDIPKIENGIDGQLITRYLPEMSD